ncbi:ABC transporter substrate-binding protein [Actinospongicola halichondriae]|uniref:ABC transporter substrate-binding protein n=1 Tax=Actinospongicola halichondriae TaxID=3236844 RepID=UPI003D4B34F3
MQPSSDQPNDSGGGGSALRRYGPIVGIVAVIAVIAAVVFAGGDDDGDTKQLTAGDPDDGGVAQRPDGAISWTQAEEEGLDLEWPDTCDQERGTVAIPFFYAPECYANVDDNGGATHTGVTGDSITVVYYSAPEDDPVLDFITGPIKNDDTRGQIEETVQGFVDLFGDYYQTYGRTVDLKIVQATGSSTDEVAARADAQRAIEEHKPFAAFGGPALTSAWADEMAAAGVVCVGCGSTGSEEFRDDRKPYLISVGMAGVQSNLHGAEYISKKLAGNPAEFAGDEAFQGAERVFGHVYLTSSEESERNAENYRDLLADRGVELAERLGYELDPGRLPEQATSIIAKLKEAGVTSVILQSDPVAPANFTQEATAQEYFPEWIVSGGTLSDTTVFGRVYDQEQWAHAFGPTTLAAATSPELDPGFGLYEWYTGEEPPAAETAPVLYPNPSLLFSILQSAGPNLTPETFRDGLFSGEPTPGAITASSLSWGEHGLWDELDLPNDWSGVDDMTEWWWDAEAVGPDEIQRDGTGMVRFVDGGKRYLPGAWTDEVKLFDEEGSILIYDSPPESEQAPSYPSPAG